ncbi:tetratricopeptide repeat protein [Synechococcus sp. BSF8S]|uniref:tetratricopeptide repeat protein n=1 Tax=Synechococcales TaxID=1890424 RepID=UPI0016244069|nr:MULTISPECIES: tetratricopeptide repeat protein [unclassified Synechococcus]MBC1260336.1 tetratricopeptide repeat protein [Synechococcus sp. BSF8S]MBC1263707.1 tetratricopeptide repeat protein [Synechococcus sp. BSA11S]
MDLLLPQAYLIGLIVLLGGAAVVIGLQVWRVRADEVRLAKLENQVKEESKDAATLYELASVQLRKRLYDQAVDSLKLALKRSDGEPGEARALMQNALGFALAAQGNHAAAIRHYKLALQAKADYPVALNNLGYALERQALHEEARQAYNQALALDPSNKTTSKRLKLLDRRFPADSAEPGAKGMAPSAGRPGTAANASSAKKESGPKKAA